MRLICTLTAVGLLALVPAIGAQSSSASLHGRVVMAEDGMPVAGAPIEVISAGSVMARAVSDQDGRFRLPSIAPGQVPPVCCGRGVLGLRRRSGDQAAGYPRCGDPPAAGDPHQR